MLLEEAIGGKPDQRIPESLVSIVSIDWIAINDIVEKLDYLPKRDKPFDSIFGKIKTLPKVAPQPVFR